MLIGEVVRSLTPLRLPGVEKAVRVPFLGGIRVAASNITLFHLDVGDNSTIFPEDSGLLVVASGITANISMILRRCASPTTLRTTCSIKCPNGGKLTSTKKR